MSITWSSGMPLRDSYVEIAPGVSIPKSELNKAPHINWHHIDGPLMTWAGHIEWLTWMQCISLLLRLTTPQRVAERIWPNLAKAKRFHRAGDRP